jgi:ABC-type amino acid transport substrate-binding protein
MVDLLCEPTSATLSRRELVDFSITTLVDGASLVIATDGPENLQVLAGRTIGVLVGTTTEQSLNHSLSNAGITAEVTPAKTHAEGLGMLENEKISAYFADRSILIFLVKDSKASEKLRLADAYPTVELYALALQKGTRACVWKLTLRSVTSTALVKSAHSCAHVWWQSPVGRNAAGGLPVLWPARLINALASGKACPRE